MDNFVVSPSSASYTNATFVNSATGFDDVQAYIDPNNNSTAKLIGTSGNERLVTSPLGSQLFGSNFQSSAWNFKHIIAQSEGGTDTADMYDFNTAANTFTASPTSATFASGSADRQALNFSKVTAHGQAEDTAFFNNSTNFIGKPTESYATGTGYENIAQGFGKVQANSMTKATLYDSTGFDQYTGSSNGAQLVGSGYDISAWNCQNYESSSSGGHDVAYLYGGATGSNVLGHEANLVSLSHGYVSASSPSFSHSLADFETVQVFGNTGASDSATLDNVLIDTGLTNRPLDGSPYNHKLVLKSYDELFTTAKPGSTTPTPHAIDEVMSAYGS